jgi:hypothetical protein
VCVCVFVIHHVHLQGSGAEDENSMAVIADESH